MTRPTVTLHSGSRPHGIYLPNTGHHVKAEDVMALALWRRDRARVLAGRAAAAFSALVAAATEGDMGRARRLAALVILATERAEAVAYAGDFSRGVGASAAASAQDARRQANLAARIAPAA